MHRIVDLTLTLRPGMRGFEMAPKHRLAVDGWNSSMLHLYSHCGTHMDAPVHYAAGDLTIDRMPLERCLGPARVAGIEIREANQLIRIEDLGEAAEPLAPGESLLLRTGWSRRVGESAYRDELPRVSAELAEWCVRRRVKILGVEPPAVANPHNLDEITEVHRILLSAGVVIVEGLANLAALRESRVFFAALPLKPLNGDGCPVRAFAIEGQPPPEWFPASTP